ncbi:MAG: hypothetical protein OHK0022_28390 [Roseiflexaceae bacterium]
MLDQRVPAAQALAQAQQALATARSAPVPTGAAPLVAAPPEPNQTDGVTQITFAVPFTNDPTLFPEAIRRFNQANPQIQVMLRSIGDPAVNGTFQELTSRVDCFASFGPTQLDRLDSLQDLQPLIDADASFARDDYLPQVLEAFQRDGVQLGLPLAANFPVLGYNKALFDAQNLAYPSPDWTLDNLLDAAVRLTDKREDRRTYGFVYADGESLVVPYLVSLAGGSLVSGQDATLQPNLRDQPVQQGLRGYLELMRAAAPIPRISYIWTVDQWNEQRRLIGNGRAGMWMAAGEWGMRGIQFDNGVLDTTVVTAPPLGRYAPEVASSQLFGLYVSGQSQQPQACWTLMRALSADLPLIERLGMPVQRSLGDSPAYAQAARPYAPEVYRAYRDALDQPRAPQAERVALSDLPYPYWLHRALDQALQGRDLAQGLDQAQVYSASYLDCTRAGSDGPACARQVAPDDPGWLAQ